MTSEAREEAAERVARGAAPWTHHPCWIDVVEATGESCRGLAAFDAGRLAGWMWMTVRTTELGTVVSSMPYIAYGGPFGDDAAVVPLIDALIEQAREAGASVVVVGTSPLTDNPSTLEAAFSPTYRFENFCQVSSLETHPLATLSSSRRSALQRKIRAASHLHIRRAEDIEAWLEIYRDRYDELGATPYPESFHRAAFESEVAELWCAYEGSRLVGGTLFMFSRPVVDFFSSAYASGDRSVAPTTAVLDAAMTSFVDRGARWLNWQSSPGRGGVYEYKRRWGASERPSYYLSRVLDPDAPLLSATPAEIRTQFPLRFVVPFSALGASA